MSAAAAATSVPTDREFVISRTVNAPRDLVWKAWTQVDRLKAWWGPKGATVFFATLELKPGGAFHYGMRAADGFTMWGKFLFREIEAPQRLVFLSSFSDEKGGLTRAPFFDGKWPMHMRT